MGACQNGKHVLVVSHRQEGWLYDLLELFMRNCAVVAWELFLCFVLRLLLLNHFTADWKSGFWAGD